MIKNQKIGLKFLKATSFFTFQRFLHSENNVKRAVKTALFSLPLSFDSQNLPQLLQKDISEKVDFVLKIE